MKYPGSPGLFARNTLISISLQRNVLATGARIADQVIMSIHQGRDSWMNQQCMHVQSDDMACPIVRFLRLASTFRWS
jgi:hypothetical protein